MRLQSGHCARGLAAWGCCMAMEMEVIVQGQGQTGAKSWSVVWGGPFILAGLRHTFCTWVLFAWIKLDLLCRAVELSRRALA